jgi:hypothetical protein
MNDEHNPEWLQDAEMQTIKLANEITNLLKTRIDTTKESAVTIYMNSLVGAMAAFAMANVDEGNFVFFVEAIKQSLLVNLGRWRAERYEERAKSEDSPPECP